MAGWEPDKDVFGSRHLRQNEGAILQLHTKAELSVLAVAQRAGRIVVASTGGCRPG